MVYAISNITEICTMLSLKSTCASNSVFGNGTLALALDKIVRQHGAQDTTHAEYR